MKTFHATLGRAALTLALALPLLMPLVGCENNRREYLLALENNDRCIEQAHVVRRDLLNNLKLGNFAGTESASKLQISLQEKLSVAMYSLDRYRPRNPDPVAFENIVASSQILKLNATKLRKPSITLMRQPKSTKGSNCRKSFVPSNCNLQMQAKSSRRRNRLIIQRPLPPGQKSNSPTGESIARRVW